MAKCPSCKKYELTWLERATLNNTNPTFCRACNSGFVNSERAVYWGLAIFVVNAAGAFWLLLTFGDIFQGRFKWLEFPTILILFFTVPSLVYAHKCDPIKPSQIRWYSKRPLWGSILFYGVFPFVLVFGIMTLAMLLH